MAPLALAVGLRRNPWDAAPSRAWHGTRCGWLEGVDEGSRKALIRHRPVLLQCVVEKIACHRGVPCLTGCFVGLHASQDVLQGSMPHWMFCKAPCLTG
eukprot:277053-Chlamydomonas_euryale.AAC.2